MGGGRGAAAELRWTSGGALALTSLAVTAVCVGLGVLGGDPPDRCGWCGTNALDLLGRSVLRASDPLRPARASHALSVGAAPLLLVVAGLGAARSAGRALGVLKDLLIGLQAMALVTVLVSLVKNHTGRERPAWTDGREHLTEAARYPVERYLSFFSGDTAWAFAFGCCAAALAWQRGRPRQARYVALVAALLGTCTGALRVAADMHWVTDAAVGGLVGALVGAGLPTWVYRRR
ncbi:MAG: phosphatase PAP2 family protein [Deltaproteobacteria bacterium]|nr:phosphatase PAP2 family protein [Deltaproteobacteria bacterium]